MKLRFVNVGKYNSAIEQLLTELNLGVEAPLFNMKACEQRLRNLEKLKAERGATAAPTTAGPVASSVKISVAAPAPAIFTRGQCERIMGEVYRESRRTFAELSDGALLEDVVARIQASRLVCPGIRSADTGEPLGNYGKMLRGFKQDALNRTLAEFKNQKAK